MKFLILYISILISLHSYSQTFNNTIDVDNNIQGFHDILYTDSIIFCSGWNHEPGVQQSILVSGFQLNGDESIQQYFGNPDYNHTENRLIQINDSLIALFGNQDIDPIENPLNNDIVILIFKKDGELISEQSYGDENVAEAVKSIMYYSDTIYITGFYADLIESHTVTFLWLFSPTGDSLALFSYGHPVWNFIGNKIIRAQNGDFLIAGYANDNFEYDRLLLRIAPNGDLLWYQIYPGVDDFPGTYDVFNSMIELEDNSILLAGRFTDNDDDLDANLVKVDADGNIIWDMLYGEYNSNAFEELDIRNDTVFIGGSTISGIPSGYVDAWITAMDTAGNTYWSHTYNPDGIPDNAADDYLYDFTLTGDGGMAFCGWSRRETQDAWVMKLDANGLCDTASCFPDLVNIYPNVMQGNPTPRLYPNPADDFIFIQSAMNKNVVVQIINMQGSLVLETMLDGNITSLNITHLPAGIYAARFITEGEFFGDQKFVVE